MLKLIFMIFGFLFALSIILFKLFVSHQKDMMIKSHFIAGMAMSMGIYILSGIILAFFVPDIAKKLIILLFALSPFIIGKLATYKLEKIYSFIQVFCVLISVVFVFFKT